MVPPGSAEADDYQVHSFLFPLGVFLSHYNPVPLSPWDWLEGTDRFLLWWTVILPLQEVAVQVTALPKLGTQGVSSYTHGCTRQSASAS